MKHLVSAFFGSLAALALSACGEPASEDGAEHAASPAAETGVAGLSVSNARLALPAVPGNPAGVFFDLSYTGSDELKLETATVERAGSTMMHDIVEQAGVTRMVPLGSLIIAAGDKVDFAPGGKHVMAMQLDDAVVAGDKVGVTLGFAGGATTRFAAVVVPAGDGGMGH